MDFYINKNATLPVLKLELIQDGRNDFHKFFELIQNADIYFTMTDVITGVKKIAKKKAGTDLVIPTNCVGEEYYLTFQFNEKQTSQGGRYVGQFEIDLSPITVSGGTIENYNVSGKLLVPIREELFINILDGSIKR